MKRVLIGAMAASAFILASTSVPCSAQALPSKKEMTSILDAAFGHLTLGREGSPPFHLVARLHYESGANKTDGIYELLWASRSRFREIFQFGPITQTDVALGTTRYSKRNTPFTSYQHAELTALLNLPLASLPITGRKAIRVYELASGSSRLVCADLEDVYQNRKVCTDPATHEISLDGFDATNTDGRFTFEASDFSSVGEARFPRHLVREDAHGTLEVRVDTLRQADAFAEGLFTPPDGTIGYDWCADPVIHKVAVATPEGAVADIILRRRMEHGYSPGPPEDWSYFLVVSPYGQVLRYVPMYRDDPDMDAKFGQYFKEQRFATKTCGSTPIGYESIFEVTVNALKRTGYLF